MDRVADQVMNDMGALVEMRMTEPQVQRQSQEENEPAKARLHSVTLRREVEHEEDEFLQAQKTPAQTPQLNSSVKPCINNLNGRGQPLVTDIRIFFEER